MLHQFSMISKNFDFHFQPGIDEANHSATIKALEDVASVRAVVIDFSFTFDWAKVAFAISCLRKKDVLYLTGVEDEWITCGHNKKVIGNSLI